MSIGLVLLFHLDAHWLSGGYVGVDVFFVISGYLITTSLLGQHRADATLLSNLARFWARRVRRLLPNALLVLATLAVVGAWTLDDVALSQLGSDIGWSAIDVINWQFLHRAADYLHSGDNDKSLLLNYWSLAVEEQFYLVWPPILFVLWRRRGSADAAPRRVQAAVALLAFASFAFMLWLGRGGLAAAFFASPARAWELMAGVALAAPLRQRGNRPVPGGPALAGAGLAAIATAAVAFDPSTTHPGWPTLLPVLGAAAVIAGLHAAPHSTLARGLGCGPMRALGARSYSIYLWHWPVLALGATWWPAHGPLQRIGLLAVSLVLAEAAYRWVETPARRAWVLRLPAPRVIAAGMSASALVLATAALLVVGAETGRRSAWLPGAPSGIAGLAPLREVQADLPVVYANGCHVDFDVEAPKEGCRFGPEGAPAVLLFGDSHAAQWMPALQAAAQARGLALVSWTKSSCPSADVTKWNPNLRGPYRACDRWREAVLARLATLRPVLVVISNELAANLQLVDRASGRRLAGTQAADAFDAGLGRTLDRVRAAGVPVVLLRDSPRPRRGALSCLYAASDPQACARPREEALPAESRDVRVARSFGVVVWDLGSAICGPVECPALVRVGPGRRPLPVYRDDHHLTAAFVATLVPALDRAWNALGPPVPQP